MLGGKVIKTKEDKDENFTTIGGTSLNKRVVNNLIGKGVLSPQNDGLFGESQSYILSCNQLPTNQTA